MYQGLQVLYFSLNLIMLVILRMGWEGNVAHIEEMRDACRLLGGNPEAKQGRNKEIG